MNALDKFFENLGSSIKKGPFKIVYPMVDAMHTLFISPGHATSTGPHVRDNIDMKRFMGTVIVALLPVIFLAMYNVGLQAGATTTFAAFLIGLKALLRMRVMSHRIVGFHKHRLIGSHHQRVGIKSTTLLIEDHGLFFGFFQIRMNFIGLSHIHEDILNPFILGIDHEIFIEVIFRSTNRGVFDRGIAFCTLNDRFRHRTIKDKLPRDRSPTGCGNVHRREQTCSGNQKSSDKDLANIHLLHD